MNPLTGVGMGSNSDWDTMQHAVRILQQFGVAHEARVLSAHRMPDDMFAYAEQAQARGLQARQKVGTALVVGGRGFTEEFRRRCDYTVYCERLKDLRSFAETLHPPTPPA